MRGQRTFPPLLPKDGTLFGWPACRGVNVDLRMDEVALRRARLVLGWVTVFGRVYTV